MCSGSFGSQHLKRLENYQVADLAVNFSEAFRKCDVAVLETVIEKTLKWPSGRISSKLLYRVQKTPTVAVLAVIFSKATKSFQWQFWQ